MNVIIAINDHYLLPAKTMLLSLCLNNRDSIKVYLMYTSLSEKTIFELQELIDLYQGILVPIKLDTSLFANAPRVQWWSEEMYYRILAFHYINEDKAIWLDSDIIINRSIEDFYQTDISQAMALVCAGVNQSGLQRLGLPDTHIYFNSGVILFNLKLIREHFSVDDVMDLLEKYHTKLTTPDQDILNIMFNGYLVYADEKKYNHETFGDFVYTRDESDLLHNDVAIIHYNGPCKPWNWRCANWADDIWWNYAKSTYGISRYLIYSILHHPVRLYYLLRELYYVVRNKIRIK